LLLLALLLLLLALLLLLVLVLLVGVPPVVVVPVVVRFAELIPSVPAEVPPVVPVVFPAVIEVTPFVVEVGVPPMSSVLPASSEHARSEPATRVPDSRSQRVAATAGRRCGRTRVG
jgi:hypothetical protein